MLHNTLQQNMILLLQSFPINKGQKLLDNFAMEQLNKASIHIISLIEYLPYEVEYAVDNLRM